MKVISYNINGIRAAIKKGLINWLKEIDVDVICFKKSRQIKINLMMIYLLSWVIIVIGIQLKKVIVEWQYYVKKSLLKSLMN